MNKGIFWLLAIVIGLGLAIWGLGFGLGGCSSTQQVTATTTTSTSTSVSSTTTSTLALTWSGVKQCGDEGDILLIDAQGNLFMVGGTFSSLEGNTWQGSLDVFLAKFDSAGNRKWIIQTGTSGGDSVAGAARDSAGNIYVAGSTDGTFPNCINAGGKDVYLLKYDSNGTFQWVKQYGTSGDDEGSGVAVDSNGNVYLTGNINGDFDNHPNLGSQDFFLVKVNPNNGAILWSQQFGTDQFDNVQGIITDSAGKIYLTGSVLNAGLNNQKQIGILMDAFIVKCNSGGNILWTTQFGSGGDDIGKGLAVDSHGNIYVGGATDGSLPGNSNNGSLGTLDVFLAKFGSATGEVEWIKQYGTSDRDNGGNLAVDSADHVYLAGNTRGAFTSYGYSNAGAGDAFLIKTDSADGTVIWLRQFGTDQGDDANNAVTDLNDNVYVTGRSLGVLDGVTGGYLMKFDPAGNKQ